MGRSALNESSIGFDGTQHVQQLNPNRYEPLAVARCSWRVNVLHPKFLSCRLSSIAAPLIPGSSLQDEKRKLPFPGGEGWGEGERPLYRGVARDFGTPTEALRICLPETLMTVHRWSGSGRV